MKKLLATTFALFAVGSAAYAIEPVPGSITYDNPHVQYGFHRAPAGSTFEHHFYDNGGDHIVEKYRIRPDRTLEIIDRVHREHG